MIQVKGLSDIAAWVPGDNQWLSLKLKQNVRERIDRETTRENEEKIAEELWRTDPEELFDIDLHSS